MGGKVIHPEAGEVAWRLCGVMASDLLPCKKLLFVTQRAFADSSVAHEPRGEGLGAAPGARLQTCSVKSVYDKINLLEKKSRTSREYEIGVCVCVSV